MLHEYIALNNTELYGAVYLHELQTDNCEDKLAMKVSSQIETLQLGMRHQCCRHKGVNLKTG